MLCIHNFSVKNVRHPIIKLILFSALLPVFTPRVWSADSVSCQQAYDQLTQVTRDISVDYSTALFDLKKFNYEGCGDIGQGDNYKKQLIGTIKFIENNGSLSAIMNLSPDIHGKTTRHTSKVQFKSPTDCDMKKGFLLTMFPSLGRPFCK